MKWILDEIHPVYGKVVMMGITGGEQYRWFVKDNLVSMIPLFVLEAEEKEKNDNSNIRSGS